MYSGTKFHIVGGNDPAIFITRTKADYVAALARAGFQHITYEEVHDLL